MDAPVYRPSVAYKQPAILPSPLNADTTSMARLMADPAARAIVSKEVPIATALANLEQMKPHWDNVSLRSLVGVGVVKADVVDRVDQLLRALPQGAGK